MSVKFSRFFPLLKYLFCVIAWFWYEIETFNYAVSFFLQMIQDLQEFRFTDERSATSQIVSKGTR